MRTSVASFFIFNFKSNQIKRLRVRMCLSLIYPEKNWLHIQCLVREFFFGRKLVYKRQQHDRKWFVFQLIFFLFSAVIAAWNCFITEKKHLYIKRNPKKEMDFEQKTHLIGMSRSPEPFMTMFQRHFKATKFSKFNNKPTPKFISTKPHFHFVWEHLKREHLPTLATLNVQTFG